MEEGAMLMPTNLQSRTQYLALAEFCQGIISSLSDYVDGTEQLPTVILQNAVEALRSFRSGDPYRFGQRPAAALGSYEQVRTLEEVWRTPQQVETALNLTTDLLSAASEDESERAAKAGRVIELFSKLQARALWNFEQPKQTAPPDVGELCRALKTA